MAANFLLRIGLTPLARILASGEGRGEGMLSLADG